MSDEETDEEVVAVKVKQRKVVNVFCAICKNLALIKSVCVGCKATKETKCDIVIGECGHKYHLHCIERWLKSYNNCPICKQIWETKQIIVCPSNY